MTKTRWIAARIGLAHSHGIAPAAPGASTQSLLGSIARVVLIAAFVWQAVMVLVTVLSLGPASGVLAGFHALVCALAAGALYRRRLRPLLPVTMTTAGVWSYLASGGIDSSLTFAACWQLNFASCFACLLILRRYAIWLVAGSAVGAGAAVGVLLPEWGSQLPVSIVVTQVSIIIAIRWGVSALLDYSGSVDAAVRNADEAALRSETLRFHSARLAEESRLLHDTVINTFGAIATAGAGTNAPAQVRAQCARDIDLLDFLRRAQRPSLDASLQEMFDQPGLPIRRRGTSDAELDRLTASLRPRVRKAIVGCVREALNNAAKHSGAESVEVSVSVTEAELQVRVADDGIGFAGDPPAGRGIATSITRRAHDHGLVARVRSTPGSGTEVTLRVPLGSIDGGASRALPTDAMLVEAAGAMHRRSGAFWGVGVTVVSIVLTAAGGSNAGNALFPMIAIMLIAVLLARIPALQRPRSPLVFVLLVATLAVFVLSARATSFGLVGAPHWQALAATGPFVLLLSTTGNRWWRSAGFVLWAATVIVMAAAVTPMSGSAAQIIVIAGLVGWGFSGAWALFQGFLRSLYDISSASRRAEFASALHDEMEVAAQSTYRHWVDAGLDRAVTLLQRIRDGEMPTDALSTRACCADEERYLRQLMRISPELVHLGTVCMSLLRLSREREIRFDLRLGDADAVDDEVANVIGEVVQANLLTTAPADALSVTVFPIEGGLHLTLIGSDLRIPARVSGSAHLIRIGTVDLLEVRFDAQALPLSSSRCRPLAGSATERSTVSW